MKDSSPLRCSFCGKTQLDVRKLIAGPNVHICDECVELCNDIIFEEWQSEAREHAPEAQAGDDLNEPATTGDPLAIRHTPLSVRDVPTEFIERLAQAGYRYVRFYRTAVTNNTDRPIRIVWFDAFLSQDGEWTASNVRNRVLRTPDFTDWYGGASVIPEGWLQPGATVSDSVNWHSTDTPHEVPAKWAYLAVDAQGTDYFAEAMVPAITALELPIKRPRRQVRSEPPSVERPAPQPAPRAGPLLPRRGDE